MKVSIITKNDKRLAVTHFYYGVKSILEGSPKQIKLRELKHQLKQLTSNIKTKYQNSQYKDDIRKALKEESSKVVALAEDISSEKKFPNNQLLYDVFDGIPLIPGVPDHRTYDMVVKQDPERIVAWVFYPAISDDFDPLKSQIEAEQDFEIPCIDIKVIGKPIVPATVATTKTANTQTQKPKQKVSTTTEILGKVLFSRKDQFKLRSEQDKDEIKGFLYEQYASSVKPHDILVLENLELPKKIYVRVSNIDVNPLSGGGYVHQFSEVVTHVLFRPLLELTPNYTGRPRPADLAGFMIRTTTPVELNEVLNIPADGFPLGRLDYAGTNDVFKYPLKPEDTIYQSVLIAGVQGKGKSNFVKLMIRSLATWKGIPADKRPAIVILDGEGEYKEFTKKSEMTESSQQFLNKYGIGDVKPKIYTISEDPAKGDSTLSMRGIERQDVVYLLPELESKSENILRVLINHVGNQIDNEKAPLDIETFRSRLLAENNNSQLIHISQRPAIGRAIISPSLNLLDQKNKIPLTPHLLFKAGTVSVIDYQGLDQNMKRVVALYLLQMLDKFKMNEPNLDPGVLLVIDEAERMFKAHPEKGERDFILRISSRLEDITNRGRKRHYSICCISHLASEVSKKVGDLTNTKIVFGSSGMDKWIRDYFGRDYVDEINTMPTGKCRISIKVNNNDQGPINAKLDIPFVGDKRALSNQEVSKS